METPINHTFRSRSKQNWKAEYNKSIEAINSGSLQRIADATEIMAKRYTELIDENNSLRNGRANYISLYESELRTNKALRGVITKLKKKVAQLERKEVLNG